MISFLGFLRLGYAHNFNSLHFPSTAAVVAAAKKKLPQRKKW
jgi:hypothetical protein